MFQSDLIQLIQYEPATAEVLVRPLMIVPPWTNKFYALDLRPRNSGGAGLHRVHAQLGQSGREPRGSSGRRWTGYPGKTGGEVAAFETYMRRGVLDSLDVVIRLTGAAEVNALGHGLGGTLLAAMLAWISGNQDHGIASVTLVTTMLDLFKASELGVFIHESQLATFDSPRAAASSSGGTDRQASALADGTATFSMPRANDLTWSFVANNSLMSNDPFPFDLLHWNNDAVCLPASMHGFYLHRIHQANDLARPNALTLLGMPVDMGRITLPAYVFAAREDHIAPWRLVYRGTLPGPSRRFMLSAAGHLAGVVSPSDGGRYSHWINADAPADPQEWLAGAAEMAGSWWPDWQRWILAQNRATASAHPLTGEGEPALGSFVQMRAA